MRQGNNPLLVRAMYIIIVPVVILIVVLNTGLLQRMLPAARVHGHSYTAAQYNYYYFDCYNSFLEDNELRMEELGYDPRLSSAQQIHESGVTWKEFFQRQAEREMAETAYYCDLAAADGYVFTPEELEPVQERLRENAAFQASSGITAANYYIAYYGRGMTQSVYTGELTKQVKADAYKAHLAETAPVEEAAIAAYIAAHPAADYNMADLRVITLDALPDRETGQIGAPQAQALREKLDRLAARYAAGESFEALQAAFSTCELGDPEGVLTGATAADLPAVAAAWCLTGQGTLVPGQTAALTDDEAGIAYFLVLDGFGGSGARREAALTLGREAVETAEEQALAADYAVTRLNPGIRLATA